MAGSSDQQRLHAAFRQRAAALRALGAPHLVDNLQAGAKPLALSRLEQKLGFPLPKVLRTLWLLHDGERKPAEGFVAPFHLLPVAWVLNERAVALRRLAKRPDDPSLTDDERASARWIPLGAMTGASVVMHATSGRVFEFRDDDPPVRLLAPSVVAWLEDVTAQRVEAPDEAADD
jgi:cell wall assembly regulator SMI1